MNSLANSYYFLNRHDDALSLREKLVQLRKRFLPQHHPLLGNQQHKFSDSVSIFMHFHTGDASFNLSISYKVDRQWHRAIASAEEALQIRQATLPQSHPHVASVQTWIRNIKISSIKALLISESVLSPAIENILQAKLNSWL